jgi:TRAP-type C4-dicarboxylate transport system permease small subunit
VKKGSRCPSTILSEAWLCRAQFEFVPNRYWRIKMQTATTTGDAVQTRYVVSVRVSLEALRRQIERISLIILYVAVAVVVFDAVLIIADVFGRTILGRPILGTVELVRNTVVLIIFCQAPATIMEGRMLRVSAVFTRLPRTGRRFVEGVTCLMGIALFVALAVDMWEPMLNAWHTNEMDGAINLKMPLAPVRTALIVLWSYTAIVLLYSLARIISGLDVHFAEDTLGH